MLDFNLARDPFVNRRPILRVTAVLWLLAVGLLALNGWLYWRHFVGQGLQEQELASLDPKLEEQRRLLDEALASLETFDLDWQRQQVAFLNARIAERTFSWSELFDHLSEVLPRNVRIGRVTPQLAEGSRANSRGSLRNPEDEVELGLSGTAEEDGALLVFVDALFAHPRFRRPNLASEARRSDNAEVRFTLSVIYKPVAPRPATRKAAVEDADEDATEEPALEPAERARS
jgi:hypothetical protein